MNKDVKLKEMLKEILPESYAPKLPTLEENTMQINGAVSKELHKFLDYVISKSKGYVKNKRDAALLLQDILKIQVQHILKEDDEIDNERAKLRNTPAVVNELESSTKKGQKFNFDGFTWKVIKVGVTSSRAEVTTKSHKGKTQTFDNKTINKNYV